MPALPRVCLPGPQFGFSEDPLLASLDYLHHAAQRAGRPPHYSGAVQAAVSAEERLYKERLARAHFARWAAGGCWWGCGYSSWVAGEGLCCDIALTAGLVGQAWLQLLRALLSPELTAELSAASVLSAAGTAAGLAGSEWRASARVCACAPPPRPSCLWSSTWSSSSCRSTSGGVVAAVLVLATPASARGRRPGLTPGLRMRPT